MSSVVFEQSYINFAWGYQNHGMLITDDGYIWKYDLSGFDRNRNYTVNDKLSIAQEIGHLPLEEMDYLLELLECAASEPSLPPKHHTGYDAGGTSYTGYLNGHSIELQLTGDYSSVSQCPCYSATS